MKVALSILALSCLAATASAEVVYQPVRYQYGLYNEVYYGGRNPAFTSNAYVYLPPALQTAYAAQRMNGSPYTQYTPAGALVSPFTPESTMSNPTYVPYIFTDYLPYEEAGQFGYTIDDARNEAYANVPRLQTMYRPPAPAAPAAAAPAPAAPPAPVAAAPSDPRIKAIPLLNWAKVERTKNPALYKALLDEARKYDPAATTQMEQAVATEK